MSNETIAPPAEEKRRGILYVTASAWEKIGKPETPDAWHKTLLLPEHYELQSVEIVSRQHVDATFQLTVASDAIPMSDAHISQVELTPFYGLSNGTPQLLRIEVNEWDGKAWNLVKTEVIKDV